MINEDLKIDQIITKSFEDQLVARCPECQQQVVVGENL